MYNPKNKPLVNDKQFETFFDKKNTDYNKTTYGWQPINPKSFRPGRYVNIDDKLLSLPVGELKEEVRKEVYRVNRNIKKLREYEKRTGQHSQALDSLLLDDKDKLRIARQKGKPDYIYKQELLAKLKEAKYFNELKTSSVAKQKAYEKRTKQEFEERFGIKIDNKSKFWTLYNDFQKTRNSDGLLSSEAVQQAISKRFEKLDKYHQQKRINDLIEEEATKIEKRTQKQNNSSFFEV